MSHRDRRGGAGSGESRVRLAVRAKPRAKSSRITRVDGLSVEVALAAPPVEGAANEELVSVLAKTLSVPRNSLRLSVGATSRNKVVDVLGLSPAEIVERLTGAVSRG
jgi:uncharacterized protein (TIGR00251 family)